jgi:hypothetical protein
VGLLVVMGVEGWAGQGPECEAARPGSQTQTPDTTDHADATAAGSNDRGIGLNGMKNLKPFLKELIVTDGLSTWPAALVGPVLIMHCCRAVSTCGIEP